MHNEILIERLHTLFPIMHEKDFIIKNKMREAKPISEIRRDRIRSSINNKAVFVVVLKNYNFLSVT